MWKKKECRRQKIKYGECFEVLAETQAYDCAVNIQQTQMEETQMEENQMEETQMEENQMEEAQMEEAQMAEVKMEIVQIEKAKIEQAHSGQVDIIMGMFALFLVVIALYAGLKVSHFMITGAYVEDALTASNLASALIDVEEYGRNRVIRIADPRLAYQIYKEALSVNLQLDEEGRSFQRELLEGPVKVLAYIVYNVEGNQVKAYAFTEEGSLEETAPGQVGWVFTPDGVQVETTTVYSRVRFGVKGLGQQYIQAEKEKSVDIVSYAGL